MFDYYFSSDAGDSRVEQPNAEATDSVKTTTSNDLEVPLSTTDPSPHPEKKVRISTPTKSDKSPSSTKKVKKSSPWYTVSMYCMLYRTMYVNRTSVMYRTYTALCCKSRVAYAVVGGGRLQPLFTLTNHHKETPTTMRTLCRAWATTVVRVLEKRKH